MAEYNESEEMRGTDLESEYDSIFSGEEKTDMLLKLTSDKFTRHQERIKIKQIGFTEPIKRGRKKTMTGLTASVKDIGVVVPIHVMLTEEGDSDGGEDDDFKYILVDGVRRVFAAMKNGIEEIDAIVWNFEDKEQGMELALTLSLVLNRAQKREWNEIWDLYQVLELQTAITPGTLEYLLQLNGGDAMKLKDVMLCDYDEPKQMLLNNEKDLEACYKLLQKLRKEEDQLAKEDATGFSDTVEGAEDVVSNNIETEDGGQLSDQDVLELLEMVDSLDMDDIDSEDFSEMNTSEFEDEHQKVGERHPVDPAVRQGTFQRDGFKCRCCGTGGVAFLGTLVYHHAIPVSAKGADTIENGLTLCDSCHQILHCAEKAGGRIPMTEAQFNEYDEREQKRIKLILKFAKIAVEAHKRVGNSKDMIVKEANKSARHRMPGETLKETQIGFATSDKEHIKEDDDNE